MPATAGSLGGIDVPVNRASDLAVPDDEEGRSTSMSIGLTAGVRESRAALPFPGPGEHKSDIGLAPISVFQACGPGALGEIKATLLPYRARHAKSVAIEGIRVNYILPVQRSSGEVIGIRFRRTNASGPTGHTGNRHPQSRSARGWSGPNQAGSH